MVYFLWFGLALAIGAAGSNRRIGFGLAFFWSLLLSPLIGAIITFSSPSDTDLAILDEMKKKTNIEPPPPHPQKEKAPSKADELRNLRNMLDEGLISQEEFDAAKKNLLGI